MTDHDRVCDSLKMSSSRKAVTLRVKDALRRDAGRGNARLDTKFMEKLGISSGDLVSITGKRRTVAKVMPGYAEDRDAAVVRIDGSIRGNAGVGIDDKVEVSKIEGRDATVVTLAPVEPIELGALKNISGEYSKLSRLWKETGSDSISLER